MVEKSQKSAFSGRFGPVFRVLGSPNSQNSPKTRDLAGKQENFGKTEGRRIDPVFRPISCFPAKIGSSGKFRSQDPVSVHFSRQGREERQEAFAMPKASWRTWRSLREEFFGSDIRSGRVNIQRIFADFWLENGNRADFLGKSRKQLPGPAAGRAGKRLGLQETSVLSVSLW